MRRKLLDLMRCPACGGALYFKADPGPEPIESAEILCAGCSAAYPVEEGVPRMLPREREGGALAEATREAFSWEWLRYPGSLPEDDAILLEESQLPPEAFRGELVLDAGCGMGRYALAARGFGAEVVAFDLSESIQRLVEPSRKDPKLHVVQGDLLRLPFKPATFDLAYSHGVLHHTADTRKAFFRVAESVKPGGQLSVWLYGRAGRYAEFRTNPLKPGREWIARWRPLVWAVVAVRHAISDLVRFFTTRLPPSFAHALSHPLTWLGAVPGLKYLTFSVHPDYRVRFFENFDWISPPYQWHHTKEELLAWYEQAGFEHLRVLPHGMIPKPGVLGRKKP